MSTHEQTAALPLWDGAADAALEAEIRRVLGDEIRADVDAERARERADDAFWRDFDGNS